MSEHEGNTMGRLRRTVFGVALAMILGGCSSPHSGPPLQVWQSSVEEYIEVEAAGDPGALRNTRDRPSRMEFGVISAKTSGLAVGETRTDVNGVLLGHRRINDEWWFIFLVGVVNYEGNFSSFPLDNPQLETVELMALHAGGTSYRWARGGPSAEALARYCAGQLEVWRASHPERAHAGACETQFPTDRDRLVLTVEGDRAVVVDENTGARWSLSVAPVTVASGEGDS